MRGPGKAGWRIPLTGLLAEGECVRVGWPNEAEFDAITALRNRDDVRMRFLDSSPLDPVRNREWLRSGMDRPYEAVLAIRMKRGDAFVGVIGWSHGDPDEGSLELGRVMVDARAMAAHRASFRARYPGVAADAGMAVRDFAFETLRLTVIRMSVIETNRLSLRAAVNGGGHIVGTRLHRRRDGSAVPMIDLECRREDWLRLSAGGPAASRGLAAATNSASGPAS
jgi:RimJ/RimL family protein N-acetyltransferase